MIHTVVFVLQGNGTRYVHLDEWLSIPIGVPEESFHYTDISKYQPHGHPSFVRKFSSGAVVVNPSNLTDTGVPLPGSYYTINSTESVKTIDVEPHTGLLLLEEPSP